MSIQRYPSFNYFKVSDTAEAVYAGVFVLTEAIQLRQIICHVYKHGSLSGTETLRAKIYADVGLTRILFQSDSYSLSTANMSTYWRGTIPLDFTSERFLDKAKSYFIAFELSNYTRVADSFYFSFLRDTVYQVNTTVSVDPLYCALIGYKSIESEQ